MKEQINDRDFFFLTTNLITNRRSSKAKQLFLRIISGTKFLEY